MTLELQHQLRPKDQAVLEAIRDGKDDIQRITETLTLKNHEVNYCFTKLEELDLIEVEKPEGYTTRLINGQKRTFQKPKIAHLTDQGKELDIDSEDGLDQYQDLTHNQLVNKIHQLESEIDQLQRTIDSFQKQVQQKLLE